MNWQVSDIRFRPGTPEAARDGLIGYVAFTLGGQVRIDGVMVRRTMTGDIRLAYPTRRDRGGREHGIVHPIDAEAHAEIERLVLAAIGRAVSLIDADHSHSRPKVRRRPPGRCGDDLSRERNVTPLGAAPVWLQKQGDDDGISYCEE